MAQLLEGRRAQVQGSKGALIAGALVHNTANDRAARVVVVDDTDAAAAEGVAPGLRSHHAGGEGHNGLLVPVPIVVAGAIVMGELKKGKT